MNMTNVQINTRGTITAHVENIGEVAAIHCKTTGAAILMKCGSMSTRISDEVSHGTIDQLKAAGMDKQADVLKALDIAYLDSNGM